MVFIKKRDVRENCLAILVLSTGSYLHGYEGDVNNGIGRMFLYSLDE